MNAQLNNEKFTMNAEQILLNVSVEETNYGLNGVLLYTYGLEKSFFITYLINQYKYHLKEATLKKDKSFYLTDQKISLDTTISRHKLATLKKFAIDNQLIQIVQERESFGAYYYINFDEILEVTMTDKRLSELAYEYSQKKGKE